MNIVLFRIDERLIHGQVAHSWSVECKPDRLMVIDDHAVNDQLQQMTLEMAVPSGKKFSLLDVKGAIEFFKENESAEEKLLVVTKRPKVALDLITAGVNIKSINVGGMYYAQGKKQISKTVFVSKEDIEVFQQLEKHGVEVEIRTNPVDSKQNLYSLLN